MSEQSMVAVDTFRAMRDRGVEFSLRNGELHYRAPKGLLTREDLQLLRESRAELSKLLSVQGSVAGERVALMRRGSNDPVQLTYAQLAHWRKYELHRRNHVRQIASATQITGRLDLGALKESIAELERRHEALRARVVMRCGVPYQRVGQPGGIDLHEDDLREVSPRLREVSVRRLIEQTILEPISVTRDPLVSARLIRVDEEQHVLVITMEHLISDGYSRSTLLKELFDNYDASLIGKRHDRFDDHIQFADFAVWQCANESLWVAEHREYWSAKLHGCKRLRFPPERTGGGAAPIGWGNVPVFIAPDLKVALLRWCRIQQTTLPLSVFAAYCLAVLRWCGETDGVIRYEINGRFWPEVEGTIGYFASGLNLRIEVSEDSTLEEFVRSVTSEYCVAYEHADHAWLDTQEETKELSGSPAFNWQPAGSHSSHEVGSAGKTQVTRTQLSFAHPMMRQFQGDAEPAVALFDSAEAVTGRFYFPVDRLSHEGMQRFAQDFLTCLEAFPKCSTLRLKDLRLSSWCERR